MNTDEENQIKSSEAHTDPKSSGLHNIKYRQKDSLGSPPLERKKIHSKKKTRVENLEDNDYHHKSELNTATNFFKNP